MATPGSYKSLVRLLSNQNIATALGNLAGQTDRWFSRPASWLQRAADWRGLGARNLLMGMGGAGIGAYRGYRREGTAWGAVKGGVFGAGVGYGSSRLGSYIYGLPEENLLRRILFKGVNPIGPGGAAAAAGATPPPAGHQFSRRPRAWRSSGHQFSRRPRAQPPV